VRSCLNAIGLLDPPPPIFERGIQKFGEVGFDGFSTPWEGPADPRQGRGPPVAGIAGRAGRRPGGGRSWWHSGALRSAVEVSPAYGFGRQPEGRVRHADASEGKMGKLVSGEFRQIGGASLFRRDRKRRAGRMPDRSGGRGDWEAPGGTDGDRRQVRLAGRLWPRPLAHWTATSARPHCSSPTRARSLRFVSFRFVGYRFFSVRFPEEVEVWTKRIRRPS
jgi:hypothetical protein